MKLHFKKKPQIKDNIIEKLYTYKFVQFINTTKKDWKLKGNIVPSIYANLKSSFFVAQKKKTIEVNRDLLFINLNFIFLFKFWQHTKNWKNITVIPTKNVLNFLLFRGNKKSLLLWITQFLCYITNWMFILLIGILLWLPIPSFFQSHQRFFIVRKTHFSWIVYDAFSCCYWIGTF